jgi:hypothetical protein
MTLWVSIKMQQNLAGDHRTLGLIKAAYASI